MVVYIGGFVVLLFRLLCVMSIHPTHASNYFMDKGECKCVPYSKNCSMEVVDITMRSSFYAKTRICWYGARLCCDKSSPSRARKGNHMDYLRGYVFRINSSMDKNNRQHASVDNKTKDEYGNPKPKVKISWTDRGQQIPKTPGIRTTIPNAVLLTTESTSETEKAEEIKLQRPNPLHRPTDVNNNGKTVLNIQGGHRMTLKDGAKSFSTGNKIIENKSADEDGKMFISKHENKGNESVEYGTDNGRYVNVSASIEKHTNLTASAVSKDNHSLFITVTTVPSKTGFKLPALAVQTVLGSYFKGTDLVVQTSNVNGGAWNSNMSKTSSVLVPIGFVSVSYGFAATATPIWSMNGGVESKNKIEVLASIFQSKLTFPSVVTLPTSTHSKVTEVSATNTLNLIVRYPSVTVDEVPSAGVVPVVNNISTYPDSSATRSYDLSNSNISLRTTVSYVYTLITRGFSYAQISSQLLVKTPSTTVVYLASKSSSKVISYTLDLTPPLILETPSIATESHVFSRGFQMITYTQNLKHPSSPNFLTTVVITSEVFSVSPLLSTKTLSIATLSPAFPLVSDVLSSNETFWLTPLQSTKTSITALSPALPLVSDVFSYTRNLTSQVSLKISLITLVSPAFTVASEIHVYNENLTSRITLKATQFTAVSTIFTAAPEAISHSPKSTQTAVLKTALITAVSRVLKIASWSLSTQTSRLESLLFAAKSPAFTVVPEAFSYTQDFTLPLSLNSSLIRASITSLTGPAREINTRTRPLIPIKMETESLHVNPAEVFTYETEDASNVVSTNRENHIHSDTTYERLSSLLTTSVKLLTNSKYEELDYSSKSKTVNTPPDPVSRTLSNWDYPTSILDYYSHKNAFSLVLHTSTVSHSSAEKYAGSTNLNKKLVTHTKHYIRVTKVLRSYVQKPNQSTIFESQPSSSVNRGGLYTNALYSPLTLSVKLALFPKVTETGKFTLKSTTQIIATHKIYDSSKIVLVSARNIDLNPLKSLSIDFVSTLKIPKLQVSKYMNLRNNGKAAEKSNKQDPPAMYIKPSSASEKEFHKFLQSMIEARLNKSNESKTVMDEGSGVWSWFFG